MFGIYAIILHYRDYADNRGAPESGFSALGEYVQNPLHRLSWSAKVRASGAIAAVRAATCALVLLSIWNGTNVPTIAALDATPIVDPTTPSAIVRPFEDLTCTESEGASVSLQFGEIAKLNCEAAIDLQSEHPESGEISWTITVDFVDVVSIELPEYSDSAIEVTADNRFQLNVPVDVDSSIQRLKFHLSVTRTVCDTGEQPLGVSASPEITFYTEVTPILQGDVETTTSIDVGFAPNYSSPVVEMTPVDFGTLRWNGDQWGTAYATSTVTVTNLHPCATDQDYTIELQINGSDALEPEIIGITAPDSHLNVNQDFAVNGSKLATVPSGFTGTTTVEVALQLTPGSQVATGHHTMEFIVAVNSAP